MSERDKQTARDIVDDYRRRQQFTRNAIFVAGFVVIVLTAVAVFLLLRQSSRGASPSPEESETPEMTETAPPSPTASETPVPTETLAPLLSESPPVEGTPVSPGTSTYQVQEGDTLATIAERFNIDFQTLLSLNPDIDPDLIVVGQELVVPAELGAEGSATPVPEGFSGLIEYEVVSGDTLLDIANRFNSSVAAIVAENGLENANDIQVGNVLRIPANVTEAAPVESAATPEAATEPAMTETASP
ncbi:MAG TPA: LysM peptidoglycan-binding domain-containing protein [Anaerolineales bacterium]